MSKKPKLMTAAEIQAELDALGPEKLIEWSIRVERRDLRRLLVTALTAIENHELAVLALGSAQDRATKLADTLIDGRAAERKTGDEHGG